MMGFVALMVLPVVIALGFSIWAGTRPSMRTSATTMTLHFAYGANMSRAIMRRHARGARAARRGRACRPPLRHHRRRLCLGRAARAAQTVHGVLWRITPRDRVTLDAWENMSAAASTAPKPAGAPRRPS